METSRQQILELLQARRQATAAELSYALDVTAADVRHHLSNLVREGVVESTGLRTSGRRGRPAKVFRLTRHSQQHNFSRLASALLSLYLADHPGDEAAALQQIVRRLGAGSGGGASSKTMAMSQRLYRAMPALNEMGYQARWEARPEAPQIIFGHCPYLAIIKDHPVLCRMDASLLNELVGVQVVHSEKLARDDQGMTYCKFMVGNPTF